MDLCDLESRKSRPLQDLVGGNCVIPAVDSVHKEQPWREGCITSVCLGALSKRSQAGTQMVYKNYTVVRHVESCELKKKKKIRQLVTVKQTGRDSCSLATHGAP